MADLKKYLDEAEKDFIDPLKDKVDKASEKPLSFMKKYGKWVVLGFAGVVLLVIIGAALGAF